MTLSALLLGSSLFPAALPQPVGLPARLRLYTIGNSLTDHLGHDAFERALTAKGIEATVARQMIPGAPLAMLWRTNQPGGSPGFTREPYGAAWNAFDNYEWDAVTLQPFDRGLHDMYAVEYKDGREIDPGTDPQGDLVTCQMFMDRLWRRSPKARVYIYARNLRMTIQGRAVDFDRNNFGKPGNDPGKITDYTRLDPWLDRWENPPPRWDGDPEPEGRAYFELLTRSLRRLNPGREVFIIPVGHALAALERRIKAGSVPGLTSVWDLYSDGIHLNPNGRYLVACVFFASLCRQSPAGLDPSGYGDVDPRLVPILQNAAWEAASTHPLGGITPSNKN